MNQGIDKQLLTHQPDLQPKLKGSFSKGRITAAQHKMSKVNFSLQSQLEFKLGTIQAQIVTDFDSYALSGTNFLDTGCRSAPTYKFCDYISREYRNY